MSQRRRKQSKYRKRREGIREKQIYFKGRRDRTDNKKKKRGGWARERGQELRLRKKKKREKEAR